MAPAQRPARARIALLLLPLLGAVGLVGWNAWLARTCPVWVVNHTPGDALVLRGEERLLLLPSGAAQPLALGEGRHALRVQLSGGLAEELAVELRRGWWQRFADRGLFVLNVAGAAALCWEEGVYAGGDDVESPRPTRILVGTGFQRVEEVDYAFAPLPDVLVGEAPRRERLTSLTAYYRPILTVMGGFPRETPLADRLTYMERRLVFELNDEEGFEHYTEAAREGGQEERAAAWVRAGLSRRPAVVPWHRYHQSAAGRQEEEAVRLEYARLAEAEPKDAGLQYLAGRVEPDPAAAEARYQRALELAPGLGWAWHGRAFLLAARGELAAASESAQRATRALPEVQEVGELTQRIRLRAGQALELRAELLERERRRGLGQQRVRWLLEACAAAGDDEGLRAAAGRYQGVAGGQNTADARLRALRVELTALELERRWDELLAALDGVPAPGERAWLHLAALLELGRPAEAEALVQDEGPLGSSGSAALLLALAWELAGDSARAGRWRESGAERWGRGRARERLAARALRAADPLSELPRVALDLRDQATLLLVLAAARPELRRELLARAAPLVAGGEVFPARLLRRAQQELGKR